MRSEHLYVLDTDTFSLYRGRQANVRARIASMPPARIALTIITLREQLDGWYAQFGRKNTPEEEALVYFRMMDTVQHITRLSILPYTVADIARFEELRRLKLNVGSMDLRIAAIVLGQGAVLVTRNRRDFERVPGLQMENWAESIP